MNDIIDIEIILKRQKYNAIYNIGILLVIIIIAFIYITHIYNYKTYYISKGIITDGNLKLAVNINDVKYITSNSQIKIDSIMYSYVIDKIDKEIYVDENLNNYQYIYLKVKNLDNIENYVYEIKLTKENKKIIEYLKEYI